MYLIKGYANMTVYVLARALYCYLDRVFDKSIPIEIKKNYMMGDLIFLITFSTFHQKYFYNVLLVFLKICF